MRSRSRPTTRPCGPRGRYASWSRRTRSTPWLMLIQSVPCARTSTKLPPRMIATGRPARTPAAGAAAAGTGGAGSGCCSPGTGPAAGVRPAGRRPSGYATFPGEGYVAEVAGRPMFAALHMLLERRRPLHAWPRKAATARDPGRQPQVPERRLHAACRAGAWRPLVRTGPRLPGGVRCRTGFLNLPKDAGQVSNLSNTETGRKPVLQDAPRGPEPRLRRPADGAHAAGLRPVRRGPRPACRAIRCTPTSTR